MEIVIDYPDYTIISMETYSINNKVYTKVVYVIKNKRYVKVFENEIKGEE